ncbi:glycosyl transferase family 2 [Palleronia aestuarii]|uniref:Glycosyl transferase family 2 n=1 Tax=Palleronia aestuarii TaxID=568105 RepID=A0A2W7Q969_9RHOB|nr:glycosyltransferase family 2 protein [Palleronia aestuarii]PZX18239.1 glycosyl transferase family 2 [Palleronia aestuarii]
MDDPTTRVGARPTWTLCIATINRADILHLAIRHALTQTVPPEEIVVIDASADWEASRDAVRALTDAQGVRLVYEKAEKKSLTAQRNQGASHATGEILFFFDDDTLMYPDCAERVLSVYAADPDRALAALGAISHPMPPAPGAGTPQSPEPAGTERAKEEMARRESVLTRNRDTISGATQKSRLLRFVKTEVLMMSMDRVLVPYDAHRARAPLGVPRAVAAFGLRAVGRLPGFGMTVRRAVWEAEPFDGALLAYCPAEDLDASYRWGRHGAVVIDRAARIHHYEVAASRLKRRQVTRLSVLNSAYLLARNSDARGRHVPAFYLLTLRKVVAELIKDLGAGRYAIPQARGAAAAMARSVSIFRQPPDALPGWYTNLQQKMLTGG